jgi:hypothetical protein
MREDLIEMTRRELERWQVIQKVMLGELTQAEGGEILGQCERQVRRLVKKGRKKGVWGLIHGSRGKESPRKMAEELEERIVAIIRTKYPDFSPLHATEKLGERHRIEVSREKVRQVNRRLYGCLLALLLVTGIVLVYQEAHATCIPCLIAYEYCSFSCGGTFTLGNCSYYQGMQYCWFSCSIPTWSTCGWNEPHIPKWENYVVSGECEGDL